MAIQLTAEFIDVVLAKMDSSLERVLESQGRLRLVQLQGAELDLLRQVELARDFMLAVLRQSDRANLQSIFGGDCSRVSHVRAVLENTSFSEMNAGDQRLRTCIEACESVEKVLADVGLKRALSEAQEKERACLVDRWAQEKRALVEAQEEHAPGRSSADRPNGPKADLASEPSDFDACIKSALQASLVENAAIELDHKGKLQEALQKYDECEKLLAEAIAVALSGHEEDHPKLVQHREEVLTRMTYLRAIAEGELPKRPVEEHIHAVQLSMCVGPVEPSASVAADGSNEATRSSGSSVAKYVALGVVGAAALSTGGFIVLGGAYMAAGASAAAGVAGAGFCAAHPKTVGSAAQQAGSAANDTAEKAKQLGKQAAMKAAQVSGTSSETAKHLGSKLMSGLTGASSMISSAASEGSQQALKLKKGITTKLADTGASVSETAAKVTASGAESASKFGDVIFDRLTTVKQRASTEGDCLSEAADTESGRGTRTASGSWLPSTLDFGLSSVVSKAMGSTSVREDDVVAKVDDTPAAESTHELRLEVVAASDLGDAEYRVGDYLTSAVSSDQGTAYVELQLGGRLVSTMPAPISATSSGRCAAFVGERHLFVYNGEHQLSVCVREQRKLQSMMRGDPIIGDGHVPLGSELSDCQSRSTEADLWRNGAPAGRVKLRYQLLPVPGQAFQAHDFAPQERSPQISTQADGEQACDSDFQTPPGSPKRASSAAEGS